MYRNMYMQVLRNLRYKENILVCRCQYNYKICCSHASNITYPYRYPQAKRIQAFSSSLNINSSSLPYPARDTFSVNHTSVRHLTLTSCLTDKEPLKPSSKVEVTVQVLKQEQKSKEVASTETAVKTVSKKSVKQKILDELNHYYHGFRLLFMNVRVSSYLTWRILRGKTLTRREHQLLVRTVGDMFRLVPFSVFIIVPFAELLLPFAIKFFPGMLPSTFETSSERENKMKQNLKVKLEMAKFLQETLDEMAVQHKDRNSQSAKEFTQWFHKIRTSDAPVSNEDILKFAKLFKDDITLDSLSRGQLVALCRVLEVQTLGTNNLLRFQLRMKLRSLAADDKLIQKEGVESLTIHELQQACRARGMRAYGMPEWRMRSQLSQWLDLSLNQLVPPSLLLLSRAMMLPETIPTTDKLKATISVLPDTIVVPTKAAIGESEGKIDNQVKLEVLKEEIRKVKEEREEIKEEKKRKQDIEKKDQEILLDKAPILDASNTAEIPDLAIVQAEAVLMPDKKKKETQISSIDLGVLEDAIETLAQGKKKLILEKEGIEDLKEEMADYQEDLNELKEVTSDMPKPEIKESKAAKRLYSRVNKMIKKMDTVLSELENKEQKMKKDLAGGESKVTEEDIVRIDELLDTIRQLRNTPDESVMHQIQNILGKMDDDHDGSIRVEDVLKVIELIGTENVQLNAKQLDEVIELLNKEEILEVEDRIEKALQKEKKAGQKTTSVDEIPIPELQDKEHIPTEPIPAAKPYIPQFKSKLLKDEKLDAQSPSKIPPPNTDIGTTPDKSDKTKTL